ncbi:unnamed protein product [Cyclocybe aegerita]|uniref:Ubiquitin-like domain-containing protein n=1 Tax=Cyclocybe aegerita TaxID=1973307 RepID=A0A8S0W6Q2_CYCAE|nr:unnamed protein product [Cyclocybe aegerita]
MTYLARLNQSVMLFTLVGKPLRVNVEPGPFPDSNLCFSCAPSTCHMSGCAQLFVLPFHRSEETVQLHIFTTLKLPCPSPMARALNTAVSGPLTRSNLSVIQDRALDLYIERTGKNIRKPNSCSAELQPLVRCQTSAEARDFLGKMLQDLRASRTAAAGRRPLLEMLKKLLDIVLIFNDAAAELASALGAPGGKAIILVFGIMLKAVRTNQERLEELEKLLEKLLYFCKRFNLREKIRDYIYDTELFASIFAAILNVIGLATTIIKGRWIPNVFKGLLGNKDIHDAVTELDRLLEVELQSDVVQLLVDHKEGVIKQEERDAAIQKLLQQQNDLLNKVQRNITRQIWAAKAASSAGIISMESRIGDHMNSVAIRERNKILDTLVKDPDKNSIVIKIPNLGLSIHISSTEQNLRMISKYLPDETSDVPMRLLAVVAAFALPTASGSLTVGILNAAMFLWYICGVPRFPSRVDITILDVERDKVFVMRVDDCETWEGFHSRLAERFKDPTKAGHGLVQKGQYEIEDEEHNVVITREDWKPKPGMVLGITVVLACTLERRASSASVACPYCESIVQYDRLESPSRLTCTERKCNRTFSVSDIDSYTTKHPLTWPPFAPQGPVTSAAEPVIASTTSGTFRKVRLLLRPSTHPAQKGHRQTRATKGVFPTPRTIADAFKRVTGKKNRISGGGGRSKGEGR